MNKQTLSWCLGTVILLIAGFLMLKNHGIRPTEIIYNETRPSGKVVALTYDDGPHPKYTPEILEILNKYHAKATFFMIGQRMEEYPEIVDMVRKSGNEIENHTYDHPHDIERLDPAVIREEIDKCNDVIKKMTGKRARYFRTPRGMVNKKVISVAHEAKVKTVLWTVSADHHDAPTPKDMAKRVIKKARPGSIILIHDGYFNSRRRDVEATEIILNDLSKKGYKFVTLHELLR